MGTSCIGLGDRSAWSHGPTHAAASTPSARRSLGRLANLTDDFDAIVAASRDTNADDEHDPEGATIAFERSQVSTLVRDTQHHLAEIDAAVGAVGRRHVRDLRTLRSADR